MLVVVILDLPKKRCHLMLPPTNLEQTETTNNGSFKNSGNSRKFGNKGSKIKFENNRSAEMKKILVRLGLYKKMLAILFS